MELVILPEKLVKDKTVVVSHPEASGTLNSSELGRLVLVQVSVLLSEALGNARGAEGSY
jgi:hypothetical protein